jgi:hypothetical protein
VFDLLNDLLSLFGFNKHQFIIASFCLVVLLGNFLGGLLRSISLAYGGPIRPRKATDSMAFRMVLASELTVAIFALWYHGILVSSISVSHLVYWVFTLMTAPVLAFIGSQVTHMIFSSRIQANKAAYQRWVNAQRAKRSNLRTGRKGQRSK